MAEWTLSVSELNEYVRLKLAGDAMLRRVLVKGEISGFKRHVSGHIYFTLKDASARVSCAMFRQQASRLDFRPEDGQQVVVTAAAGLYTVSGTYQLYVEEMKKEGAGNLFEAFEKLKRKLADEGLFDPSIKKPIPLMPRTIGVATSRVGAAFHDIVRVARARNPKIQILICPCAVQGAQAAGEIARSIDMLNRDGRSDVILVGRGGGSMEDLWAFNEEIVARAIHRSRIPVISCVGHEVDFTIADFTADVRAATPSNAAEIAVSDVREWERTLNGLALRLTGALASGNKQRRMRLEAVMRSPLMRYPERMIINDRRMKLEGLLQRLSSAVKWNTGRAEDALERLNTVLTALNPERVLMRGYAYVEKNGGIVSDALALTPGDDIKVRMNGYDVGAAVQNVSKRDEQ
ncbi:MAG: exodeoxyribonuclease VII large subunit [Clostridia bacterium]|nr:exodeoxyribonuclease VII large subunit [Clostridia bacterium]